MANFFHTPAGLKLAEWLGWSLIRGICLTNRMDVLGMENVKTVQDLKKPVILALWHGRHFLPLDKFRRMHYERKEICVMASRSRDGEILARILNRLGLEVVRGSSSRGGAQSFLELKHYMDRGYDAVIAVDGPRGPREVVKPGVLLLAQKTGYPIVPLSSSATRCKIIASWDRYLVPYPFSKGVTIVGKPMFVPPEAERDDLEKYKLSLENQLKDLTRQADDYCRLKGQAHGQA
jgi:lysophospholipid acyltransferase (LPLAT)-like uncharacterized protein